MGTISRRILDLSVLLALAIAGTAALAPQAEAARPGTRASASGNVNRAGAAQHQRGKAEGGARAAAQADGQQGRAAGRNAEVNRSTSTSRSSSVDIDSNREVHIDVDDGCCNDHWDDHPVATAAAVTGAVALTSAVIGSIVYSVPPSCVPVMVNGINYQQCGSTWYQPQYAGTAVQYVVVPAP